MSRIWIQVCAIPAAALLVSQDARLPRHAAEAPLSIVSGPSPYPVGCQGSQPGTDYLNAAVETMLAADPANPRHLIGVWQQNRWSNGAADGLMTAVSTNGGMTWNLASAAFTQCSGGVIARGSDPWATIAPDGTAYQIALSVSSGAVPTGVLVSRSTDAGYSWSTPMAIASDNLGDDKETITADPKDANFVYAVWDWTNVGNTQPAVFSKTANAGANWTAPRAIYSPGTGGYTCCNQIDVLPDGTLVDIFVLTPRGSTSSYVAALQSADRGDTWGGPFIVANDEAIGVVDARTQAGIRTGNGIPSSAVDPSSGAIYVAWEDARYSGEQREGVVVSKSTDGGFTWSNPAQMNRVTEVQAFLPTIAVGPGGAVAITYYDFRQAGSDPSVLPANVWLDVSDDGGATWRESPVAGPFDIKRAALSGKAYFLGDYQGLAASGGSFVPFFAATNAAPSPIPSSVFASPRERAGRAEWDGHVEVNRNPLPLQVRKHAPTEPRR